MGKRNDLPQWRKDIDKLQKKLGTLPLMPRSKRLRKKRDKVSGKLHALAKEHSYLPSVDLMAGTRD